MYKTVIKTQAFVHLEFKKTSVLLCYFFITEDSYKTINLSDLASLSDSNHTKTRADNTLALGQKWTSSEVLQLLHLYKTHEDKFRDPKMKKKSVWEEISKKMHDHGYLYSGIKCEVKFKNLKQKYVKTIDHNNKSGNSLKTCSFYNELNEIFAYSPSVTPVAECSNRKGYSCSQVECTEGVSEKSNNISSRTNDKGGVTIETSLKRKLERSSVPRTLASSLAAFHQDLQKDNAERLKKMEEMHQAKMKRFDRLLDLYEKDISAQLQDKQA